jgi:hypothetical protein
MSLNLPTALESADDSCVCFGSGLGMASLVNKSRSRAISGRSKTSVFVSSESSEASEA